MALFLKVMRWNNGTRPQQPRVLTPCKLLINFKKYGWMVTVKYFVDS
jgi:hypothetical protein